jgi:aryl-alcohol dehydrogenase-like predicted oxidoreductase
MDRAADAGVYFFDTAEVYPVPPDHSYVYATEEIVGRWLRSHNRDAFQIATKFCGSANAWFKPPVREGHTAIDRHHIRRAIEGSLRRLGTDYVDLYQTHWPDHDVPYEPTLEALDELVQEGLVRYLGCSNETPWGLMKALGAAERCGLNRYESIQNNFSLINRRFEDSLAEVCRQERISLLPYSPMGGGVLSGKYNQPTTPEGARFSSLPADGRRATASDGPPLCEREEPGNDPRIDRVGGRIEHGRRHVGHRLEQATRLRRLDDRRRQHRLSTGGLAWPRRTSCSKRRSFAASTRSPCGICIRWGRSFHIGVSRSNFKKNACFAMPLRPPQT